MSKCLETIKETYMGIVPSDDLLYNISNICSISNRRSRALFLWFISFFLDFVLVEFQEFLYVFPRLIRQSGVSVKYSTLDQVPF